MKKFLLFIFFSQILYAQYNPFESGYSGIGIQYSKTIDNKSLNSIVFKRNTASGYLIEASLNYVDDNERAVEVNSTGLGFSKMLFKEKDNVPVSGYTRLGIGFIKFRDFYYRLSLGFGIFHNSGFDSFALIPEFFVNYNLLLNPHYTLLNPEQYMNSDNMFILGVFINNLWEISQHNSIIISPGIVSSDNDYAYQIKIGLTLY